MGAGGGLWGFCHSCLQPCSYNSPLHFGLGTRLTVTGKGLLPTRVPVYDHGGHVLGGEWGVKTGQNLPCQSITRSLRCV